MLSLRDCFSSRTRFARRSTDARVASAVAALNLMVDGLPKADQIVILNSVIQLYHGMITADSLPANKARLVVSALGYTIAETDSDDSVLEKLQQRFLTAEALQTLTRDDVSSAKPQVLVEWLTTLGVAIPVDSSQPSLECAVIAALDLPPTAIAVSPNRFPLAQLAEMPTEELRIKRRRLNGDDLDLSELSRRDLIQDLLLVSPAGQEAISNQESNLSASDLTSGPGSEPPASELPPDSISVQAPPEPSLRSPSPVPRHLPSLQSFDSRLSAGDEPLPKDAEGKFTKVLPGSLGVGHIVGAFDTDITLFQIVTNAPFTVQSLTGPPILGSMGSDTSCWVLTSSGISALQTLLQETPVPVVPGTPFVNLVQTSNSPQAPSVLKLLANEHSAVHSEWGRGNPPLGSPPTTNASLQGGDNVGILARQDRYEDSRGLRTLLNQDLNRFYGLTNNTGKLNSELLYNNIIILIPMSDRSLPALSRKNLKHLVTLQFALSYDEKSGGIHLQSFRPQGKPFFTVAHIHDALLKLVRTLDIIRAPVSMSPGAEPSVRFFYTLFSPVLESLTTGDQLGLMSLPCDYVLQVISDLLLQFGCRCNCPEADQWRSAEAQALGLAPCLRIDVSMHIGLSSIQSIQKFNQARRHPSDSGSNKPPKVRGRAYQPAPHRGVPPSVAPATGSSPSIGTSSRSSTPKPLCLLALLAKYSLSSGCRRGIDCPYEHSLSGCSKAEEKTAAGKIAKQDLKTRLLDAIG
jgi:hypothetical protein